MIYLMINLTNRPQTKKPTRMWGWNYFLFTDN